MYIIGLYSSSTTDSERKQQCVTLDHDKNDLGSVEKWQVFQLMRLGLL